MDPCAVKRCWGKRGASGGKGLGLRGRERGKEKFTRLHLYFSEGRTEELKKGRQHP